MSVGLIALFFDRLDSIRQVRARVRELTRGEQELLSGYEQDLRRSFARHFLGALTSLVLCLVYVVLAFFSEHALAAGGVGAILFGVAVLHVWLFKQVAHECGALGRMNERE